MRYLSLFSGIEAATSAWRPLGWECVAVADIETFPGAVLKHHYPTVPNMGDVTAVTEAQIAALGQIDIVVFGSPCQDLSIAGKRKGLDGERSGLFFTAIRIVEWARRWCGCRFALWENVPGAFSSNEGRDFAAVVEHLAGIDTLTVPPKGWGNEGAAIGNEAMVEWSTLDAQWFGVAQRRRRVFALADFVDWANRPPILLEPESLRGDSAPRREARQGTSPRALGSVERGSQSDIAISFRENQRGEVQLVGGDGLTTQALSTGGGKPGQGYPAIAYGISNQPTPKIGLEVCPALDAKQSGGGRMEAVAYSTSGAHVAGCLDAQMDRKWGSNQWVSAGQGVVTEVAYSTKLHNTSSNQAGKVYTEYTTSLDANSPPPALLTRWAVRRLTPVECERLQGFPDHHTSIPWRNKPVDQCPDGPRYKALGNSMAVPVMHWIGQRIDFVTRWF